MTGLFQFNRLVETIEGAADWRLQKADEYSHDTRNERSAQALAKLAQNFRKLSADEPLVVFYEELWNGAATYLEDLDEFSSTEGDMIKKYGFDEPEDGEPLVFLDKLTEWLQRDYQSSPAKR